MVKFSQKDIGIWKLELDFNWSSEIAYSSQIILISNPFNNPVKLYLNHPAGTPLKIDNNFTAINSMNCQFVDFLVTTMALWFINYILFCDKYFKNNGCTTKKNKIKKSKFLSKKKYNLKWLNA